MPPLTLAPRGVPGGAHRKEAPAPSTHLDHVDGLRGVAIAMVVVFHLFVGRVSAGVDVFLFLGGVFLLSSQLRTAQKRELSLSQSILRIIRRLAPTLIVVVAITTIASLFVYPSTVWPGILSDASAGVLYYTNWNEIAAGNTYGAAGIEVSTLQHLWSMSVQMQSYLAVIITASVVVALTRLIGAPKKVSTIVMVSLTVIATVASGVYAAYMVGIDQPENYYSTLSRFYEIGLGALLGMILRPIVLPVIARWILGVIGLVVLGGVGMVLDGVAVFPGPWVLIPLVAAAMLVLAGKSYTGQDRNWRTLGPVAILSSPPAIFLGKIAYALYLVHWPLLILAYRIFPEVHPMVIAAGVGLVSLPLAYGLHIGVTETLRQQVRPPGHVPLYKMLTRRYRIWARRRRPSPWYPISAVSLVTICAVLVASPFAMDRLQAIQTERQWADITAHGEYGEMYPGVGEFLVGAEAPEDVPLMPPVMDLAAMMPPTTEDGCYAVFGDVDLKIYREDGSLCWYGDTESDKTMYVAGGSHAEQYITALDVIGKRRGFKVLPIVKMGCALNSREIRWDGTTFEECQRWSSESAVPYIIQNPPTEGVFMTATRPATVHGRGPEMVPDSYVEIHQELSSRGIHLWSVRDNPWMMMGPEGEEQKDVRVCLSEGHDAIQCGQPRSASLLATNPALNAYRGIDNLTLLDFTDALCTPGSAQSSYCPGVIGNIVAYRDSHHLTAQLIETMIPMIEGQMFNKD